MKVLHKAVHFLEFFLLEVGLTGCLGGPAPSFSTIPGFNNTPTTIDPEPSPEPTSTPDPGPQYTAQIISDTFSPAHLQKQDLLFVIDDSGSMGNEIDTVEDKVNDFLSAMSARQFVDYQAAVVTTDVRHYQGELMSADGVNVVTTSTPISTFENIISAVRYNVTHPTATSWHEMSWLAAKMAIEENGSLFMRADVPLAVIVVSDEEEQSCAALDGSGNCVGGVDSATNWVNYFKSIPTSTMVYNLVGNGNPLGSSTKKCSSIWSIGHRYLEFSNLFGGDGLGSICEADLADDFVEVGNDISERGICFHLSETATGNSISVAIGSTAIPNDPTTGYVFDSATNSICFPGTLVDTGASNITVQYEHLHQNW